jgi:hypothetical protein
MMKMNLNMTRKRAFLSHFCLSALIVLTVLTVILLLWYPPPFLQIVGAFDVIKILIAVDLILGPLLTLILFKPGKKGLMFDMSMVAALQLCALVYGVHTLYIERPYYTVFVVDRFQILAERDIDKAAISNEAFLHKPWSQPIYVAARMPNDPKERSRITEEIFFEGKPDVHQRPELWESYAAAANQVSAKARPLTDLVEQHPGVADQVETLIQNNGELVYLPVMGRKHILTMVLDAVTLRPIDVIEVDPWGPPKVAEGS